MVVKTTELPTISSLEKENAELKRELAFVHYNRKLNDFMSAFIWAILLLMAVSFLATFAEFGGEAFAIQTNMGLLGSNLLSAILILTGFFLKIYVVFAFFVTVINIFEKEIGDAIKRMSVFFHAGQKAVKEAMIEANKEEAVPATETEATKPARTPKAKEGEPATETKKADQKPLL